MTKKIICLSAFLIFILIAPGFADEHFPFLAEVSKESVNVRAGPNTNFEKIDKIQYDFIKWSYFCHKFPKLGQRRGFKRGGDRFKSFT